MLKSIKFFLLWVGIFATLTFHVNGAENKGADHMKLPGGLRGDVPFPHRQHQDTLKDCNACHTLFPQSQGAITTHKAEGKLGNKQVMNKLCIKCHRAARKAGDPSGPTSCKTCHIK